MRITKHIIFFVLLITFICSERSVSQPITPSDYNTWAAGLKYGMLTFYGDVRQMKYSSDNPYRKINTGLTFEGIKNFNQTFGAKAQLMLGNLSGSNPYMNLHFKSNIDELSVLGVVNLNDLISYYPKKNKIINTYLFAGFGILEYRAVVRTYNDNNFVAGYGWDSTGAKTAMQSTTVFPFGIGIKLKANPKIDVGIELSLHLTNTNKLDAWAMKNSYNDRYSYLAVSFTYKIGKKKEYVEWVNPFKDTSKTNIALTQQNNSTDKTDTTKTNNFSITIKKSDTPVTHIIIKEKNKTSDTINTANAIKKTDTTTINKANDIVKTTNIQSSANATNKAIDTVATTKIVNQPNKKNDSLSTAKTVSTSTNNTAQNNPSAPAVKKFFIIAGSFPSEQEALDGVKDLKTSGYPDAEVVGKNDADYWRICYKGFTSMDEANSALLIIKRADPSAWIFEKK